MEAPKHILRLAQQAYFKIPAYRKFLKSNGWKYKSINSKNFFKLPIMGKKTYIKAFSFQNFFPDKKVPEFAFSSSGSSGEPTFWFRNKEQELAGAKQHAVAFSHTLKIKPEKSTLIIVAFSMGVWIAGNFTASCARLLRQSGWNITVVTPGIEIADTLHILKIIAPEYDQIILAGYPSLVADILQEAIANSISIPSQLRIITAGDSFEESWRKNMLSRIPKSVPEHIISIYGSADAGIIGHETPFSILLRQELLKNTGLMRSLIPGKHAKQPAIFQYDPKHIYIESINQELLFSVNSATPLVRYNINDRGIIIQQSEIYALLKKHRVSKKLLGLAKKSAFPIVIKYGRTDVAVTFYALNIYPEHIDSALRDKKITSLINGGYKAYSQTETKTLNEKLIFEVEPSKKYRGNRHRILIQKTIINHLIKLNTEFRKLHSTIGRKSWPEIKIKKITRETTPGIRALIGKQGKKPKLILT